MVKTVLHIAEASGGVERFLVTLLTKLKKYPEYEHILVCSQTIDKAKFDGLVKEVVVIDSMHNAISFSSDSKAILSVRKTIRHYKPDVVYCHSSKAGAIGRIANFGIKNKLVYNAHGWAFNMKGSSRKKTMAYALIEKMLAPMADKIVCISEYEKKSALKHKICSVDKLKVINNGIDLGEYTNVCPKKREELSIPENAYVVGMIGRLCKQKAPEVFVDAAITVKKHIHNAFFVIVGDDIGDGSYGKRIKAQIKKNHLENSFLITGWVDDPLDYACCFDAAALLSRWEGFGLVLPEYMLLGKPIVASKADAIPYVVGDAGLLAEVGDHKQAANFFVDLYKNKSLYQKIVENGKERVKRFDAQRMADEHKELFQFLTNKG